MFKKKWVPYTALALGGFLFCFLFIFLPNRPKEKDINRYQILEVQNPDENTFLLDTKTGRVWEYIPDILESEETGKEGTVIEYYFHENAVEDIHPTNEHTAILKENARRAAVRRSMATQGQQ